MVLDLVLSDDSSSDSDSTSSSSSSSISDDEAKQLYEVFFERAFAESPCERPKVVGYIADVVHMYSDEEFRRNFRVSRSVATDLVNGFEASPMYPRNDNGGSPAKTAEEHVLAFLWYAANKACIRDVAGRFGLGETTVFRIIERMMEYFVELAKTAITFPTDLEHLSADFEQVSGVPGTVGCIDGSYISIRCPANKVRSTYVNRHNEISLTVQAVCDHRKVFLDVTTGNPSKVHDSRIFRKSRFARKIPLICAEGRFHVLGDAAYPLREFLLTPFRNYGKLTQSEALFNMKFSATRVKIENAFADLKGRFRQLLHLDFFIVDKMNKFILSCCVLHNLCVNSGDTIVPPISDDGPSNSEWQSLPLDESECCGPLTASETVLRRQGELKREAVMQAMNL